MEDFKHIQIQLQQAKRDRSIARKTAFLSTEKLSKLGRKKAQLLRNNNANSDVLEAILFEENQLQQTLLNHNSQLQEQIRVETDLLTAFQPFTDPREHIEHFSDDIPVLLLPVRLETRFKEVVAKDGGLKHQLWVRVFPDECSINTFEDTLSETEVKIARDYWQLVWAAGQSNNVDLASLIQDKKKAAWRGLAGNLQPGRAYWVTQNYQPVNLDHLPKRQDKTDVFLTISVEEIPAESEVIANYWKAYCEAEGDTELIDSAFQVFVNEIGNEETANELIGTYVPFNIDKAKRPNIKVWFVAQDEIDATRKAAESEVILTIVLNDGQVPPPEQEALKDYWKAFWLANGDGALEEMALADLQQKIGDIDRANELIVSFEPDNLSECLPPNVAVHFVQFPKGNETSTQLSSWTRAARATTLPDKFVLMGYKGINQSGQPKEVFSELGNTIPDPLIIGPDPSLDTSQVLKEALIEDYRALADDNLRRLALTAFYNDFKDTAKAVYDNNEASFIEIISAVADDELDTKLEQVFEDIKDEVKAAKYIDYLCQRAETKWLFDFEEAVRMGMGFKVDLSPAQYNAGFDRLFVVGVKLSADELEAKTCLEELFQNHHYGSSGLAILPQGTPTNNTETTDAGFSENEDSDASFNRYLGDDTIDDPDDFFSKKDGKWLCELLGIDAESASLKQVENYYHTDQCEAKAMNAALWQGTLGYFMESMLTPVFNDQQKQIAKDYFTSFVSGRGNIPAIRIGDQPYGILAVSKLPQRNWLYAEGDNNPLFSSKYGNSIEILQGLYTVLMKIRADFKTFQNEVAFIGKEGDQHQILLDVLGLHATSVEFHQRYAQSFAQLFNHLNLTQVCRDKLADEKEEEYQKDGLDLLKHLGYQPDKSDPIVPILEKFFLENQDKLKDDDIIEDQPLLVDDQPLSEINTIRAYTSPVAPETEGKNYIHWLVENAINDFNVIKRQQAFADKAPNALLYQMLRHSLILAFSDTALNLYLNADLLNQNEVVRARIDADFIPVLEEGSAVLGNRYAYLDQADTSITAQNIPISEHISSLLVAGSSNSQQLNFVVKALNHLKDVPTARLERALVEHLDCCFYRLDAWLLGFVNLQLNLMRYDRRDNLEITQSYKPGVYLGAYGWVENLQPEKGSRLEAKVLSPELEAIFDPNNEQNIVTDTQNAGYIHAPSINQAITAAVLRNAYVSDASPTDPEVYKVNLSSERVRMALSMIEGMQQGQGLSELLGYQLERGLHDRNGGAEVDEFIYALREKFPLRNKLNETAVEEEDLASITQIEARNVVDGIKLAEHLQTEKETDENYSLADDFFPGAAPAQKGIIDTEVERILNIQDAIADVAIAEGVHQVVQSNFDRAAGNLDTYSKGGFPQTPDVTRTPRSGVSLTNRFAIHFKTGIIPPAAANPRVKAEPAINDFLTTVLPKLKDLACQISYHKPNYEESDNHPITTEVVEMNDLELSPLDLFYLLDVESGKSLTTLDELLLKHVYEKFIPRPDVIISINYTVPIADKITVFEIAPLIKNLRSLILTGRPLKSTDVLLPNEASSESDLQTAIDVGRINGAFDGFKAVLPQITNDLTSSVFKGLFDEIIGKDHLKENEAAIINTIDAYINKFISHLHKLNDFGTQQAGFGFVYDRKASIYSTAYKKVLDYKNRWENKTVKYKSLLDEEALIADSAFEQKIELLQKMERTISTEYTIPVPSTLADVNQYRTEVIAKRAAFELKFGELTAFLEGSFGSLQNLVNEIDKISIGAGSSTGIGLEKYDLLGVEIETEKRQIAVLGEDMVRQVIKLDATLNKKKDKIEALITQHNTEVNPLAKVALLTAAAQHLFGEEFKVIPEFNFTSDQKIEIEIAYTNRAGLLTYQKTEKEVDFPVDDWLYSMARVREKLGNWEMIAVLAESFNGINDFVLDIEALQFPYKEKDSWLGLSYPEDYTVESDKLLYTAFFGEFVPSGIQCGLLLDEWTEVIPAKTETTGVGFQYDQPNAEAPQSILLVTPARFTGAWEWDDLADTLHETLELARLRAVEPKQIDETAYAQFLPATVATVTTSPLLTIALNYAVVNGFESQTNPN